MIDTTLPAFTELMFAAQSRTKQKTHNGFHMRWHY
jgi:hypothetical protein